MKTVLFIIITLLIGGLVSCSQDDMKTIEWEIKDTNCPCEKPELLGNVKGEIRIFNADNTTAKTVLSSPEALLFYLLEDNAIYATLRIKHQFSDNEDHGLNRSQYGIICNLPIDFVKNITIPQEGISGYYEGQAYQWCEESDYGPDPYFQFAYLVVLNKLKIINHEN